ncbi:MAG: flap endonuclease-1 [Candidatus Micrarchaeota archaeon]|nr:flap endonuclease-1 [Candidatus Micrarchaeota archaeon]
MAVDLSKLVSKRKIEFGELQGRVIAIDAYNVLYQFLSIIRQADGTPLMDSQGNVTSHLSGIFYRTIELVQKGIHPVYVFDGLPSVLKQKTIQARMRRREEAREAWMKAKEEGRLEEARMRAQGATRLTKDIVESGKDLVRLMGIPVINAPSEGEAQASYMAMKGLAFAVGSQDYDTMLFGAPDVIRNLTLSGRRKLPRKNVYINIEPEIMSLQDTLASLGISRKQLIWIGILLGTDFNEGIDGVGPKTALKIVKECRDLDQVVSHVKEKYGKEFELDVHEVEELFLNPEVGDVDPKALEARVPDTASIIEFMCDRHDFLRERIEKYSHLLAGKSAETKQRRL